MARSFLKNVGTQRLNAGQKYLAPLLLLALILFLEYLTPVVVITPVCCMLSLIIMSNFFSLRLQLFWVAVYAVTVFYVLHSPVFATTQCYNWDDLNGWIRSIGFPLTAMSTLLICHKRSALLQSYKCTLKLIHTIPDPLVVSNEVGEILLVNKSMSQLLNLPEEKILSSSYFKLFSLSYQQGVFISSYLDRFDNQGSEKIVVDFITQDNVHRSLKVDWVPLKFDGKTVLVSFFAP